MPEQQKQKPKDTLVTAGELRNSGAQLDERFYEKATRLFLKNQNPPERLTESAIKEHLRSTFELKIGSQVRYLGEWLGGATAKDEQFTLASQYQLEEAPKMYLPTGNVFLTVADDKNSSRLVTFTRFEPIKQNEQPRPKGRGIR